MKTFFSRKTHFTNKNQYFEKTRIDIYNLKDVFLDHIVKIKTAKPQQFPVNGLLEISIFMKGVIF